jgi:hypothetical protein
LLIFHCNLYKKMAEEKRISPDHEQEPVPTEYINDMEGSENMEHDMDDLVHNSIVPDTVPAEDEVDADDAIHSSSKNTVADMDEEKDPDDLVHGN